MFDDEYISKMKRLDYELDALDCDGGVAVAFSGGIDSAFLLAYANEHLCGRVVAITVDSAFFPDSERHLAESYCADLGVEQYIIDVDVLGDDAIACNPKDRCYQCKRKLFTAILDKAWEVGRRNVVDGTNADDSSDDRPGMRALDEMEVRSPLKLAGLTKDDIRTLAHDMGIEIWDKPSSACLATRFPTGVRLVEERLQLVEDAEDLLHRLGFDQCRVRVDADSLTTARIEVEPERIGDMVKDPVRRDVVKGLRAIGFSHVALDLAGYGE